MQNKNNPFRTPTKEELELKEKKRVELEKLRKETEKQANKCLNHKDFVKYRQKYEALKNRVMDYLITYDEPDPMTYAMSVKVALAKLHQLNLLIHDVELDNRSKGKK